MTLVSLGYRCVTSYASTHYSLFFFFFQAEDGIRDYKVTGVQTCALPICKGIQSGKRPAVHPRYGRRPAKRNQALRSPCAKTAASHSCNHHPFSQMLSFAVCVLAADLVQGCR